MIMQEADEYEIVDGDDATELDAGGDDDVDGEDSDAGYGPHSYYAHAMSKDD